MLAAADLEAVGDLTLDARGYRVPFLRPIARVEMETQSDLDLQGVVARSVAAPMAHRAVEPAAVLPGGESRAAGPAATPEPPAAHESNRDDVPRRHALEAVADGRPDALDLWGVHVLIGLGVLFWVAVVVAFVLFVA